MADEWEAPSTGEFLSGSGGSSASSPYSSLQHIPAYNYFDAVSQQLQQQQQQQQQQLQHHLQYQPNTTNSSSNNSSNKRSTKVTKGAADRNYRNPGKAMERAAYTNRSFMHHNEYDYYQYQQQQQQHHKPLQRSGFVGGGGFVSFESSHYGIVVDHPQQAQHQQQDSRKSDRRRHSMHHIAQLSASKMDDLKQRFDEYTSSAAVARGNERTGGGGGSRRPSPQNSSGQLVGGGVVGVGGGRLNHGYSGSRSLDIYEPPAAARTTEGGGGRQNGTSAKTPKRGSRSSQGSTDSSHSSHSASSGSLLLTVANLENFAKIHKKQESSYGTSKAMEEYLSSTVGIVPTAAILDAVGSKYNSNITMAHQHHHNQRRAEGDIHSIQVAEPASSQAIISIEEIVSSSSGSSSSHQQEQQDQLPSVLPSFHRAAGAKTKDPDSVSVASSTHFTMVNGVGGPQRRPKSGICSRGHQITILIVTMSIVFMVGICAAVFFLEMRAREMPR